MTPVIVTIVLSISISAFVIELIRSQRMTFKYSLFWLLSCLGAILFSFQPDLLLRLSDLFGFELLSNFIFFCFLAFFTIVTLFLTIYINQQNMRNDSLVQTVGILEAKLRELEKKTGCESSKS